MAAAGKDVRDVIQTITDRWFMSEPLMFSIFCSHKLSENRNMRCAFRSGNRKIEYNPLFLEGFEEVEINELLRREVLRIILKHPYERQPVNPVRELLYLASNLTIYEHKGSAIPPEINGDINIPHGLSYEEYYNFLLHNYSFTPNESGFSFELNEKEKEEEKEEEKDKKISSGSKRDKDGEDKGDSSNSQNYPTEDKKDKGEDENDSSSQSEENEGENAMGSSSVSEDDVNMSSSDINLKAPTSFSDLHENGKDAVDLWENDEMEIEYIDRCIENCMLSNQWGSIPGIFQETIIASTIKKDNIRRKLDLFRTSIISTDRRLTRMRPSRRYGWQQMGVVHPYVSKLLIAIDTSASVNSRDLARFFSVVNTFFTYGIPSIDVVQFDTTIHFPLLSLKKAQKEIKVRGRGGTDFQAVINYYTQHKEYDGMLVFTDGYAPLPTVPPHRKILWVLQDIKCYNDFKLDPKVYI